MKLLIYQIITQYSLTSISPNRLEMKRRNFLVNAVLGSISMTGLLSYQSMAKSRNNSSKILLRIGICADLHQDIINDAPRRLQLFINEMNKLKPDFIVQMGDFCEPKPTNQIIMDIWNQFTGPKYHVIGNHDTDGGFTHDQVVNFWSAKDKYYSFDKNGYHFIVLNANEEKSISHYAGPPGMITDTQKDWLEKDIADSNLPVIVFCHQGIDNDAGGVDKGNLVRVVFDRANQKSGTKKVQMVFSGHHHQDYYNIINGIHYVQINSMSYQWMGDKYASDHYSQELERAHPVLKDIAPYADPIWAFATIYKDGSIKIEGKKSFFVSPTPDELHRPEFHAGYPDVPYVSDRFIKL